LKSAPLFKAVFFAGWWLGVEPDMDTPSIFRQTLSTNVLTLTRFRDLQKLVRQNRPNDDLDLLRRAYDFSARHHLKQVRMSGEPYLSHPLEVAHLLAEMKLDVVCIATGLLHDVVEDTEVTPEEVTERFGPEIAHLVEGLTKIGKLDFSTSEARQAENVRKMLLAMVDDIRVILVKLADRLHNMRTLRYLPADRQQAIARETMEIYAPLAHRLGMSKIRGELEDLAFGYLEAETYHELQEALEAKRRVNEGFLAEVTATIQAKMTEHEIAATVEGRIKRVYSIYQKLRRQRITLDQVYDLLAVRILTNSVKDCYGALGVIHNLWRPVPGRIKDFIAMPRPNLYQSLHTSVITETGQSFEVQIRTNDMHRVAELGIAAHWKYKEGKASPAKGASGKEADTSRKPDSEDRRIAWLRQLVEWAREMQDPGEFLSSLKIDLYPEEVYTFTPKGRVIILPRDATAVDFAYAIHSEVGHACIGAKVNGRIVPLRYKLRNGEIVEILTQQGHTPSRDWLTFVRTSKARNKIRHWLNVTQREQAIEIGRRLMEKEARKYGVNLKKVSDETYQEVAQEYGCHKAEDLFAGIGFGKFSARQVLVKLAPEPLREQEVEAPGKFAALKKALGIAPRDSSAITVRGASDLLVYRAKCCNPIRGEEIVGYVTRGKGIAVHSRQCPNVANLLYEPERKIEVEWARAAADSYPVKLVIHAEDRPGMMRDLTSAISADDTNIRNVEAKSDASAHVATIDVTIDALDTKHLERIVGAIRKVSGVHDVTRILKV
jgi:GTP pyrophosphokinase